MIARSRLSPSVEVKDFQFGDTSFVIADAIWLEVTVGDGAPLQVICAMSINRVSAAVALIGKVIMKIRHAIELQKCLLKFEFCMRLI